MLTVAITYQLQGDVIDGEPLRAFEGIHKRCTIQGRKETMLEDRE